MKILVANLVCVLLVVPSLAYPQDAELIPSKIPRRGGGNDERTTEGDGVFIINMRPSTSMFDIFRSLLGNDFRSSFGPVVPDFTSAFDPQPRLPDFSEYFPDFSPFPRSFPDFSDLPDNYDNSTHEVKIVNGTKIETNRTTIKSKGDNGVLVTHFHVVRYSPENDEEFPGNPDVSRADTPVIISDANEPKTTANEINPESEIEDFGIPQNTNNRRRRWISQSILDKIRNFFAKEKFNSRQKEPTPPPRSLHGDTRVNYIPRVNLEVDPFAEVVDWNKLLEDKVKSLAEKVTAADVEDNRINSFVNADRETYFSNELSEPLRNYDSRVPIRESISLSTSVVDDLPTNYNREAERLTNFDNNESKEEEINLNSLNYLQSIPKLEKHFKQISREFPNPKRKSFLDKRVYL